MFGSKLNTVESLDQNKDTGSNLGETFICRYRYDTGVLSGSDN